MGNIYGKWHNFNVGSNLIIVDQKSLVKTSQVNDTISVTFTLQTDLITIDLPHEKIVQVQRRMH